MSTFSSTALISTPIDDRFMSSRPTMALISSWVINAFTSTTITLQVELDEDPPDVEAVDHGSRSILATISSRSSRATQGLDVDAASDGLDVDALEERLDVDVSEDLVEVDPLDDRLQIDPVEDRLDVDPPSDLVHVERPDDAGHDLVGDRLQDRPGITEQRADHPAAGRRRGGGGIGGAWPSVRPRRRQRTGRCRR